MKYGYAHFSFLVIFTLNGADEQGRRNSYSMDNRLGSPHANSTPQLINYTPTPNIPSERLYPELSTSAPANLPHMPSAPHISEYESTSRPPHYQQNNIIPTSPEGVRKFQDAYIEITDEASQETRPGFYKTNEAPSLAVTKKFISEINKCDQAYQALKTAASKMVLHPRELNVPTSPPASSSTSFTFMNLHSNKKKQIVADLRRETQPQFDAEKERIDMIFEVTATVKVLTDQINTASKELNELNKKKGDNDIQKS